MSNYADPATINWNNPNKLLGRKLTKETLDRIFFNKRKVKRLSYFCLPAHYWAYETEMVQSYPSVNFDITGVEQDSKVYRHAFTHAKKIKAKNAKFKIYLDSVSNFFSNELSKKHFDIVNLDWMGVISREKITDLVNVFRKNIAKEYTLILTMGTTRTASIWQRTMLQALKDKAKTDKLAQLILESMLTRGYNMIDLYRQAIPIMLSDIAKGLNKEVVFQEMIKYPSTAGHSQLVFFFKVKS